MAYLYRAVDKFGSTIEFHLSPTRNARAAKRFLGKALRGLKGWEQPRIVNTDKAPTYAAALAELGAEGKCREDLEHRQVKHLNNIVEGRPRQAEAADQTGAWFQDVEIGLRRHQGVRSHASVAQGPGISLQPYERHER